MKGALRYLLWRSFLGAVRVRLSRLKQPKYWLGVIGICLYFGLLVLPGLTQTRTNLQPGFGGVGMGFMLLISFALGWVIQGRRAGMGFTEAETELLFCAPLTRHQLLRYRLAKVQPGLIFSTLFLMLVTSLTFQHASFLTAWLGTYFLFNLLFLQGLVAIVLCNHWKGRWFAWPLRLGIVALFLSPLIPVYLSFPGLAASGKGVLLDWAQTIAAGEGAGVWLWPWLFLGKLPFTADALGWLSRLACTLGLWGVGYWLVLRYGVGFEEQELAGAKARADALSAARRGRLGAISDKPVRAAWRKLSPEGPLWQAIAWKNFTSLTRHVPWGLVLFLLFFILQVVLLVSITANQGRLGLKLGGLSVALAFFFAAFGSQFIKEDLRADLSNIELIKAMPLAAHQLVRGEIYGAASVVILGVFGFLVLGACLFLGSPGGWPYLLYIGIGVATLLATLSALVLVTFFVDNALVLLFPAWILPGERASVQQGGVEQLGRSVINMFIKMVALLLFSLLPGFFAGITWFLAIRLKMPWLVPTGAGIFAVVMLIQIEAGILWLAGLFENLDPSLEGL